MPSIIPNEGGLPCPAPGPVPGGPQPGEGDPQDGLDLVAAPAVSIDVADTMGQPGTRALQAANRRR
jgi:hypothetical protein